MSIPVDDVVAIEKAGDVFIRAVNTGDISALSDFFARNAAILPPARGAMKGEALVPFFRNMALQNTGLKLLSDDMEPLGATAVRDSGTLSMRSKQQQGERVSYKYLIVWEKVGADWKMSSMMWNRGAQNRRKQGGDTGSM